jgi:uncharacterized protein DUF6950
MTRYPDWPARLEAFLRDNATRKFRYGSWDCCLMVCEAIDVMTGFDPGQAFRGAYYSLDTALLEASQYCGQGSVRAVVEAVARDLSLVEVKPAFAQRGDVALLKRARGWSLGLVALDGAGLLVAGAKGIVRAPVKFAQKAWHV